MSVSATKHNQCHQSESDKVVASGAISKGVIAILADSMINQLSWKHIPLDVLLAMACTRGVICVCQFSFVVCGYCLLLFEEA